MSITMESHHGEGFTHQHGMLTINNFDHQTVIDKPCALARYGFRQGRSGAHASRTLMLAELQILLKVAPDEAAKKDYIHLIVEDNILGKRTLKSRKLTSKHLMELYGLDDGFCLFRVFRRFWQQDQQARPVLALTLALARDPILRRSWPLIVSKKLGELVERTKVEDLFRIAVPGHFSHASLRSFAQNINGSWTQAGFLHGRVHKIRVQPIVTPTNLAFALFLAHLEGLRAQRLFSSDWARLLPCSQNELVSLAQSASRRGLFIFMNAGGVMEVRFPGYLTQEEEGWLHE